MLHGIITLYNLFMRVKKEYGKNIFNYFELLNNR